MKNQRYEGSQKDESMEDKLNFCRGGAERLSIDSFSSINTNNDITPIIAETAARG